VTNLAAATEPTTDPDVASFVTILEQAADLQPEYDRITAELSQVLEQYAALDLAASEIRAKLLREGRAGAVDGRGWPGMTAFGCTAQSVARIAPFALGLPQWPKGVRLPW